MVHPDLPGVAFIGINHGILHMPIVEVGALWWTAVARNELLLPSVAEQRAVIEHIKTWKSQYCLFEPAIFCGVNARCGPITPMYVLECTLQQRTCLSVYGVRLACCA
jgi:hypothetical protein